MVRKHALLFTLILAVIPLLGWWTYGLFDLDEGFYAAITAEMNRRGEWITPFYNGHPWFEKPILLYWLSKPCLALFGTAVGPRLPSVLATVGTYSTVGWFARRRFGEAAAVLSVIAMASSLLVVGIGRMMLTDPLLLLALTGAVATFWESLVDDRRWRLATALCLGLGVLAKGPIAGILFVAMAAIVWWKEPDLRPAWRGHWLAGTGLFLLVVAVWYLPAYLDEGQLFVQKFLIEQNVGRFAGGDKAHTLGGVSGLLFYVPILLLGLAPWSFLLPRAVTTPSRSPEEGAIRRYLVAWAVVVFVFFTSAGAKLPSYILPLAPPCAMLVGSDLARRWGELTLKRLTLPVAWLLLVGALAQICFSGYYYGLHIGNFDLKSSQAEIHRLAQYVREHALQGDQVVEYEMGRQQRDLGTGKAKIQETAEPSTLMILNRDAIETDDWASVMRLTGQVWILTRWNRITSEDAAKAGPRLRQVATPCSQDLYRLYILGG